MRFGPVLFPVLSLIWILAVYFTSLDFHYHICKRRSTAHLSSAENLELSGIKNAIIKCCVLMLLGEIKCTVSSVYWQRYNQEEGEGPFFHNGNICTLNRILGLLTRDFLTCPPNLFPKACSNQPLGKRST